MKGRASKLGQNCGGSGGGGKSSAVRRTRTIANAAVEARRGDARPTISAATREDIPAIAALLRAADLRHEDFAAHIETFLLARRDGKVVGAIGAEVSGRDALLRSLVVAGEERGRGLGGRLIDALERAATSWGVKRWWLLTTTAEAFFAARGFRVVERCDAPAPIRKTRQFQGGCGELAVCLTRERRGRKAPAPSSS